MSEKRKVPKSFRMQAVLDRLERYGRQDKNAICIHVAQKTDEDQESDSFIRAIYRDLEDLVRSGKILVEYFARDGALLEDYDPDIHKNVSCQWFIPEVEGQITGGLYLKKLNGLLYAPNLLKNEMSILSYASDPDPKHRHIYFQIGSQFLCLKANRDAIDFGMAISRTHGNISSNEINEVKKVFGSRSLILKLPIAKLSSYKPNEKICNSHIRFLNSSEVEFENLGASNKIILYKLTMNEADEIKRKGDKINEQTATTSWVLTSNFKAIPEELKENCKVKMKCPLLIEFGETFHILIM